MKRSSFVIDSEWLVDDAGLILKDPLNVLKFFSLNVPEKVLVPGVAMRDALNSSCDSHIINFK